MGIEKPPRRKRRHSEEFKDELVRACSEPGISVAGIALANGVNANLLRKWMGVRGVTVPSLRRRVDSKDPVARTPEFLPVAITPTVPSQPEIRIEARRGNAVVKIEWPVAAAAECAAWLRGWLK
ncbi:MAG: transposase [Sulfuritalea sp.]|nr:transposase [Sulfuritalea sp.]